MMLRTLFVSPCEALAEESGWDAVRSLARGHAACALMGEVFGDEAVGFAALSHPDLLIATWGPQLEAMLPRLREAAPEARVVLINGPSLAGIVSTTAEGFESALERIVDEMSHPKPDGPRTGKVLLVYGPKGGTGRSQLATNLAIALARGTGRETILLDGAMGFGEQDLFLNLHPHGFAGIVGPHRLDAAFAVHPTGVKLLAAAPGEAPMTPERMAKILGWLQQRDAWIVIDTHPALHEINRLFLKHAERVYLPMALDLSHLRALQRELVSCREAGIDSARFEFVCLSERSEVSREDASRTLKRPIDWVLPYDPTRVRAAINQGIPILQSEPRGALARELSKMVSHLGDAPRTMALVTMREQPWQGLLNWIRKGPAPNGYGV